MHAWLVLQGFVVGFCALSEWAVRSGRVDGRVWMRGLLALAVVGIAVPQRAAEPVERLVPVQAAIERLGSATPDMASVVSVGVTAPASIGLVWLAIAAMMLAIGAQAVRRWRLVHAARPLHAMGRVRVVVSDRVAAPCALWLGRHWVVLDRATAADRTARLIAVQHELQHIRHHDTWVAWLYALLLTVCAPNPFAWRLCRNLAELDEYAVDRVLLRDRRVSPRAYGRLLLRTATRGSTLSASPGLAHTTPLHRRLNMFTSTPPTRRAPWLLAAVFIATAALAAPPLMPSTGDDFSAEDHALLGIPEHVVVDRAIERLTVDPRGKAFVERALARRPEHRDFVQKALRDAGLPVQLEAVVFIESGYDDQLGTSSIDSAAPADGPPGAGLWMFIPSTAREYGLRVDATVDERFDVVRETDAAIALLSDLHAEFGDWGLALAAYNQGPTHVKGAISDVGSRDVATLVEAGALGNYVPMVWAGMLILAQP